MARRATRSARKFPAEAGSCRRQGCRHEVACGNHFGADCAQGEAIEAIGKVIKDQHINSNVTSLRSHPQTDFARYMIEITRALHDLRALLELVLDKAA